MALRILGFVILSLGLLGTAAAQSAESVAVEASATPSTVGPNGTVTFALRVEGASRADVDVPDAPPTDNLVLQRSVPSTRQSISYRDGVLQRSVTFEWQYRPLREGDARIQSTEVVVNGERHATAPIRIDVAQPPVPNAGAAGSGKAPMAPDETWEAARLDPESLFLQAHPSARRAYENQQVTVEYRLFFRPHVRLRRSRMADAWNAPGFWREELDVPPRPVPQTMMARGRSYETIVLKRAALFPTRPGTLQVDPLRIETEAQGTPHGLRGRFEVVTVASDPIRMEVRPLPSGAPAAFRDAVGQFEMEARMAEDTVAVGNGTELRVLVRGTGNLPTLSPPTLEAPSSLSTYGPDVDVDINRDGGAVTGTKTFSYTIVPQRGGRHMLPPLRFGYFDPETERYESLRSEPIVLYATGNAGPAARGQTGDGFPVGGVAGLITDRVRWVRADAPPLHRRPWAYGIVVLVLLLGIGGVAYRCRARTASEEVNESTSDSAPEGAHVRLEAARQHHRAGEARAFYETIEGAVRSEVTRRLGVEPDAERDRIVRQLVGSSVPAADREGVADLLDTCEAALFGPETSTTPSRKRVLDQAESLLRRLDKALPNDPSQEV